MPKYFTQQSLNHTARQEQSNHTRGFCAKIAIDKYMVSQKVDSLYNKYELGRNKSVYDLQDHSLHRMQQKLKHSVTESENFQTLCTQWRKFLQSQTNYDDYRVAQKISLIIIEGQLYILQFQISCSAHVPKIMRLGW